MRLPWEATPCSVLLLLVGASFRQAAGTGAHAVSQAYTFRIREDGKVNVHMAIEFHVAPGATLSGSYKSILDSNSVKSLEGIVVAQDSQGRSLDVTLRAVDGWLQAAFMFPQPVHGDSDDKYRVDLVYNVVNGICSGDSSFRFYFPWAHRWMVPVTESKYKIHFPNTANSTNMDELCLAGTSYHRRCGHVGLKVQGLSAEHSMTSFTHGMFFEWPQHLLPLSKSSNTPKCRECGAEDGCAPEKVVAVQNTRESQMLPQAEDVKTSTVSTVVVVLAIVLCCFLAFFSIFLRRKLHQWAPKSVDGSSDPEAPVDGCKPYIKFDDEDAMPAVPPLPLPPLPPPLAPVPGSSTRPPTADANPFQTMRDHSDDSWCPHPHAQSIGVAATADITLDMDYLDDNRVVPAVYPPPRTASVGSHSSSASPVPPPRTASVGSHSSSGSNHSASGPNSRHWEGAEVRTVSVDSPEELLWSSARPGYSEPVWINRTRAQQDGHMGSAGEAGPRSPQGTRPRSPQGHREAVEEQSNIAEQLLQSRGREVPGTGAGASNESPRASSGERRNVRKLSPVREEQTMGRYEVDLDI